MEEFPQAFSTQTSQGIFNRNRSTQFKNIFSGIGASHTLPACIRLPASCQLGDMLTIHHDLLSFQLLEKLVGTRNNIVLLLHTQRVPCNPPKDLSFLAK